jgi:hypothetical protein
MCGCGCVHLPIFVRSLCWWCVCRDALTRRAASALARLLYCCFTAALLLTNATRLISDGKAAAAGKGAKDNNALINSLKMLVAVYVYTHTHTHTHIRS